MGAFFEWRGLIELNCPVFGSGGPCDIREMQIIGGGGIGLIAGGQWLRKGWFAPKPFSTTGTP
jgi:hypothetical protein